MYKTLFIALLLILKISPSIGQSDWKLRTETEGIKIYTSLMPDSKIKAIKVEGDYHATASQMVALIMDVNTAPEWVYHTKSCALVKQISPSELYYYSEINLPWPAANREFVAHCNSYSKSGYESGDHCCPGSCGLCSNKRGHCKGNLILMANGSSHQKEPIK